MPNAIPKSPKVPLAIAAILIVVAILIAPMVIRKRARNPGTDGVINARKIGFALFEFENDYGTFPSEATAALVTRDNPDHGLDLSGTSSNALFRQLFAAGYAQSEEMFYAKVHSARKPDGDMRPGHLLEKGEVGFGCIAGLTTAGNPARVVAFAPIIPGTTKFDRKPFEGRAVLLRADNSAVSYKIAEDGHVYVDGINILSAANPIWEGKTPDIRYPE